MSLISSGMRTIRFHVIDLCMAINDGCYCVLTCSLPEHNSSQYNIVFSLKRSEFLSLFQCYKIVFGIDSFPFSDFFEPEPITIIRSM